MNNRDKNFVQKIKDNAFYLALGLGLFAILAVVGVYTAQQNDTSLAESDMDLNVASNYSEVSEEDSKEDVNAKIVVQDTSKGVAVDMDSAENEAETEDTRSESVLTNEAETEEVSSDVVVTTADPGQLTFNSEETISWPVNGEVILPYSMETTVYFQTLDQYQCNSGMLIQAGQGTTVKNAYLGKVTNITSDNTYGNMVTLYIGNEYSIVYGQLDTVYVKEGDFIKAGESVGTIGNPTDSFTAEGSHLFFQMKCGEELVDPMLYIE